MRIYLSYNRKGEITEVADAGYGFTFNRKEIENSHPNETILEIDEQQYERVKDALENFRIVGCEIKEKSCAEKNVIKKKREEWKRDNTVQGLKKQIEKIKKIKLRANL